MLGTALLAIPCNCSGTWTTAAAGAVMQTQCSCLTLHASQGSADVVAAQRRRLSSLPHHLADQMIQ